MINLGWSAALTREYQELIVSHHHVDVITEILDLNNNRLDDTSAQFYGGQITIDAGADITRAASLTFLDPTRKLVLDSASPADGALFMDRMMAIYYRCSSPDRTRVFTVPVFRGPVTKLDRDAELVQVECQGKERLALDPVWVARTFKKGALKTDVIRTLLADTGETKFSIRKSSARLPRDLSVSSAHKPWTVAKAVARGMGHQLFYDGRGIATTRIVPTAPVWAYRDANANWSMTSRPQIGYDISDMTNTVVVKGAIPKGKKTPITYRATLPRDHPFSPWSLGRNGKPRYISREIQDDSITSYTEAKTVGLREVTRGAIEAVSLAFDALPVPYLEEWDPYKIETDDFSTTAAVKQLTLPLSVSSLSSVGYLRSVKPNKLAIRRRR